MRPSPALPLNRRQLLQLAGGGLLGLLQTPVSAQTARDFSFALIGDNPYSHGDVDRLRDVMSSIDPRNEFVIHIGDLKSSNERCDDELLQARFALLRSAAQPLVYLPGDNEWSDCHKTSAGGFRPFERLGYLRQHLFASPRSLAKPSLVFEQQSLVQPAHPVPENLRWQTGAALFITLNRPGGVDLRKFTNEESDQLSALHQANESWLRSGFAQAKRRGLKLLVVMAHANPHFENDHHQWRVRLKRDRHASFRNLLADLTRRFDGQVLFLHGDTHWFQVNQPLLDRFGDEVPNFTRVECFGMPFSSSWVQIRVTPDSSPMFSVSAQHYDALRRP
jgi:hypothetical protein